MSALEMRFNSKDYGISDTQFKQDSDINGGANLISNKSDEHSFNSSLTPFTPASSPILDVTETTKDTEPFNTKLDCAAVTDKSFSIAKMGLPESIAESKIAIFNSDPTFESIRNTCALTMPLPNSNVNILPMAGSALLNTKSQLPAFEYIAPIGHAQNSSDFPLIELNRVGVFSAFTHRRPRGEKRPIPDEQKDDKYYERRKRNNEAAKKSRDARKIREDHIAFRAALLEQENSILRAQILALRDEVQTLRQLISATAGRSVTQI